MHILFDIGATHMRFARTDDQLTIGTPIDMPTPSTFSQALAQIKTAVAHLSEATTPTACVGGIAGQLDQSTHVLLRSHMQEWVGKNVSSELQAVLGCPVYITNDAALGGLGEAIGGAGVGYPIVAYITVSSGVGGVRIVNGAIDANVFGFEPGHQVLEASAARVALNQNSKNGTLETLVGGIHLAEQQSKAVADINDAEVWQTVHWHLACGLYNTILFWSPSVIVLGGGIVEHNRISAEDLKITIDTLMGNKSLVPPILKAQLGTHNGLFGALEWLKRLGSFE